MARINVFKRNCTKNKNGSYRKYAQFVESLRTEKGPRQNILLNIGLIDSESGSKMIGLHALRMQ